MKIELLESNGNELKFLISGTNEAFVNTLRRVVISEVPVMAVEEIHITKNNSVLYDEILAHRLGLIPLTTDLKTYKLPSECKCEGKGCEFCRTYLTLNVKGPKVVYASDLKSKDPKVKPVYPDIPIVKLLEGQKIKLKAIAVLGVGRDHMKFSPCFASFKNYPELKVDKNAKNLKKAVEECPRHVLEFEGNKLVLKDPIKCNLCGVCEEFAKGVSIVPSDDKFIFELESFGQLEPKDILMQGVKILSKKFNKFKKALKL